MFGEWHCSINFLDNRLIVKVQREWDLINSLDMKQYDKRI